MYAEIATPANNERSPRYMEKALAAIAQSLSRRDRVRLLYHSDQGRVTLAIACDDRCGDAVIRPLRANYPKAQIAMDNASLEVSKVTSQTWWLDIRLRNDLFPILRHSQFEDTLNRVYADPIDSLLGALTPDPNASYSVEFTLALPVTNRVRRARLAVTLLARAFFERHKRLANWFTRYSTSTAATLRFYLLAWIAGHSPQRLGMTNLDVSAGARHEREADLQAAADKLGGHLFSVSLRIMAVGDPENELQIRERLHTIAAALGAFTRSRLAMFAPEQLRRGRPPRVPRRTFLLSIEELATLWHPPTAGVAAERMQTAPFTELEPPSAFYSGEEEGAVPVGLVQFRSDHRPIGIGQEDRRRHFYVVGKTGMGKTTLLYNQILADIEAGRGVAVVDPHGDLAESIVRSMPTHRTNDVVLFDAADREFAIAFNPLACHDPNLIDQVTSGAVSAFKKLNDSWGPRLEDTLRNAVFATVEQGGTLLSLMQLLGDPLYRERFVPNIRDELVRSFWQCEFAGWSKAYRTEAVAAIQNKIRPFLTNTNVRAIVSQPGRSLNLRKLMDEGKVLIVNLSKGRLGEDNSTLLGAFLVTCLQQAAMTRADIPEADRRDFYLYVDEFQNFTTSSFATILSEARKYRLSLTLSHQYLKQLDESTANAVFGNVGSILTFQVGSDDAQILTTQLAKYEGQITPQDITNLPKYTAYARLLIDGMPSSPFSIRTEKPRPNVEDRTNIVRSVAMRQWCRAN